MTISPAAAQEVSDTLCDVWSETGLDDPCVYDLAINELLQFPVDPFITAGIGVANDALQASIVTSSQDGPIIQTVAENQEVDPLTEDWVVFNSANGAESIGGPLNSMSIGDLKGGDGGADFPSVSGGHYVGHGVCKGRDAKNNWVRGVNAIYWPDNELSQKKNFYLWHQSHLGHPANDNNDRLWYVGSQIQGDYKSDTDDLFDVAPETVREYSGGGTTITLSVSKGPFSASIPWTIRGGGTKAGGDVNYKVTGMRSDSWMVIQGIRRMR